MRWAIRFNRVHGLHGNMENDEAIAHALREEGQYCVRQDHFQTSNILAHDCVGSSRRHPCFGTKNLVYQLGL
jgi:hypothetical protein